MEIAVHTLVLLTAEDGSAGGAGAVAHPGHRLGAGTPVSRMPRRGGHELSAAGRGSRVGRAHSRDRGPASGARRSLIRRCRAVQRAAQRREPRQDQVRDRLPRSTAGPTGRSPGTHQRGSTLSKLRPRQYLLHPRGVSFGDLQPDRDPDSVSGRLRRAMRLKYPRTGSLQPRAPDGRGGAAALLSCCLRAGYHRSEIWACQRWRPHFRQTPGGGVTSSTALDGHGKTLSYHLLALELPG